MGFCLSPLCFEEIAYLLLFGELPTEKQLDEFHELLVERRTLPPNLCGCDHESIQPGYDEQHFQKYSAAVFL